VGRSSTPLDAATRQSTGARRRLPSPTSRLSFPMSSTGDRCRRPRCCRPTGRHLRRHRSAIPHSEGSGGPCEALVAVLEALCGWRPSVAAETLLCLATRLVARASSTARNGSPPRQLGDQHRSPRERCRFRYVAQRHACRAATVRDRISVFVSQRSSGQAAESQRPPGPCRRCTNS